MNRLKSIAKHLIVGVLIWAAIAYLLAPLAWDFYARYDLILDADPRITETGSKHPGDPLNVLLVGNQAEILGIMKAAGWYPATGLGIKSDLELAADTVLSLPDDTAPVSNLYLFGRKEDIAFEQPVGNSPRHRHHVRFWKMGAESSDNRSRWIGSAVYDKGVGLSHTTGQITHVTAPDVDAERDYLFECLEKTHQLAAQLIEPGFHSQLNGTNGGGDPWHTDGDLYVGIIKSVLDHPASGTE